jgi:hypothetical protein
MGEGHHDEVEFGSLVLLDPLLNLIVFSGTFLFSASSSRWSVELSMDFPGTKQISVGNLVVRLSPGGKVVHSGRNKKLASGPKSLPKCSVTSLKALILIFLYGHPKGGG